MEKRRVEKNSKGEWVKGGGLKRVKEGKRRKEW